MANRIPRQCFIAVALIVALCGALAVARQEHEGKREGRRPAAARDEAVPPAAPVPLLPPRSGPGEVIHVLGRVGAKPELVAQVVASLWGRVEFADGPVAVGQQVRKGQSLWRVILDLSAQERYLMDSRKVELTAAAKVAQTRQDEAEREYHRAIALLKADPNNKFRRQQVVATERLFNAAIEQRDLYARQDKAFETVLQRRDPRITTVSAPIAGVLTEITVTPGQVIPTGAFQKVCTIVDLSRVWIEADVYESDIGDVLAGAPASVSVTEAGQRRPLGRPIAVMPWLDAATRTLKVIYEVPNPSGDLRLGMTVHVRFDPSNVNTRASNRGNAPFRVHR